MIVATGFERAPGAIMLVPADPASLDTMRTLVGPMDRPVIVAATAAAALEHLEQRDVALIVMAVRTPAFDGFEAVALIRAEKRWSHIPIVFLSRVHDDPAAEARGYAVGALEYVTVPCNAAVLVAKLRALIGWYEQGEQRREDAEALALERAVHTERERILALVAHDLRSPLSVLHTAVDYLRGRGGLDVDQLKIVDRMGRNAGRMARLINDLLDFTRLQNGPLLIRPRPASLANIVAEAVGDLQLLTSRAIAVSVQTTRGTSCDADRVTQAVSNLVLNSVQHSAATARVQVSLLERDGAFEVNIWNDGELSANDAATLFQPFRKGKGSGGMGLGLYISQQIARSHGGDLTVSSSGAAGTTFTLRLPAA